MKTLSQPPDLIQTLGIHSGQVAGRYRDHWHVVARKATLLATLLLQTVAGF